MSEHDAIAPVIRHLARGTRIDVVGTGDLADELRRRYPPSDDGRPAAVVVTTDDPSDVIAALDQVSDLGAVIVTSSTMGDAVADVYGTVHARGLRLIGVEMLPRPTVEPVSPRRS